MSLRALAQELYTLEKETEQLRREFETAPPELRQAIELKLLQVTGERDKLRAILQAKKERDI
ncbi:hypothetical protein SAMN05660653_02359 [Desulfonatronum thiosulfatophilum]|uniref:Uncharacterized protein n=1 Tax=Desulfonatronum thiosulfatophilum TaxID=617002 RepID=A0A1G6DS68_9BACT|nr:hypothetical protein [Desulfonatronum thiosulfatophilum]SDB47988.1 hypothetical protein SAMN05660653_02359 [Desulfonatronum thiosulfatophilum]